MRRHLSAALDGESTEADAAASQAHVESCPDCAGWLADVQRATRRVVVTAAEQPPDLAGPVMSRVAEPVRQSPFRGWLARTLLVSLGQVQIALACFALADDHTHVGREMGAADIAVGLGVLAVAHRPWRSAGLLPVLGTFVVMLILTSGWDLFDGRTSAYRELPHLIVVAEFLLVWRVRRITGPVGSLPPAPTGQAIEPARKAA